MPSSLQSQRLYIAHQAPLFVGFPREHWSGLPFLSLGDLSDPGMKPVSPAPQVDSLPLSHQGSPAIGVCCVLVTKLSPTLATPRTVACQAPLSMGFTRQEYWSGFPFPSPGDLPDPGIEPRSPALQADSLPTELQRKPHIWYMSLIAEKSSSYSIYYWKSLLNALLS